MMSRREERCFYKHLSIRELTVNYFNFFLLEVKFKNTSCLISLSLMPEIYFSHQDKILLVQGFSGSNSQLEAFDLDNSCRYLGSASLNKAQLEIVSSWRLQIDGSKTCIQKD